MILPDLTAAVRRGAELWPDRVAWTFDPGGELSFAELDRRSAALATALAERGVGPGDRVGATLGNLPEQPLLWLALARRGAVMVALNPRYGDHDLDHVIRVSQPRLLVGSAGTMPQLRRAAKGLDAAPDVVSVADLVPAGAPVEDVVVAPADALNIQFTSGTTGPPKGCTLSHEYWMTLAGSLVSEFPQLTSNDVMLTAQAFHYIDPMWNVVAALVAGAHLVVLDGFHPSTFWDAVRGHGVTYFYCLGAMPTLLLTTPPSAADHDHRVRVVQCSAIPPARHAELEERWGVKWYEAFGMTETGADLRVTDVDHDELLGSGCVGGPAGHRQVRIVTAQGSIAAAGEPGELQLTGRGLMTGYYGDPQATAAAFADEWFRTGDLARVDPQGRVYLVGRLKDMIRRGGENIAAREVEDVLVSCPGVQLAAVVAVPDSLRGEEAKAVLVPAAGLAVDAVIDFAGRQLAPFKVPRYWELRESLPLTPSQRVAKSGLAAAAAPVYDRTTRTWS